MERSTALLLDRPGTAAGAWHGYWVAWRRVPAFVVTLASMLAFRGLINGMQPFALQIGIRGQQGNGFVGFGNDGLQYLFQRR